MNLIIIFIIFIRYSYGLVIDPPIINVDLSKIEAREIYIYNDGKIPKRYRIQMAEDTRYKGYSITDDVRVFPKIMSLSPGEGQTLRIRVTPRDVEVGEYKTFLVVKEIPIKINKKENSQVEIPININNWISIYGNYKDVSREVSIETVIEKNKIISEINSTGNGGKGIYALVSIGDGNKITRKIEIGICRIMRSEKRVVTNKIDLKEDERIEEVFYF